MSTLSRVLVTGASGFVGSWLVRRLLAEGIQTRALKRGSEPLDAEVGPAGDGSLEERVGESNFPRGHLDVRTGDVTDFESVRAACDGVDVVFHLAGLIAHSGAERAAMKRVNVEGTRHVVEACVATKVRRLINLSSVAAVGSTFDGTLLTEDSINPTGHLHLAYGETKREAEEIVRVAALARRIEGVSLNPGTIYGPGDAKKATRSSMLKVARGKLPFYTSGGVNIVDVESVCDALIASARLGRSGERYLLGGDNVRLREAFGMIAAEAGARAPWVYLPNPVVRALGAIGDRREARGGHPSLTSENAWNAILFHWIDSTKARLELGFKPKPARDAIAASVAWSRAHGLIY